MDQSHNDTEKPKMSFLTHLEELRWRLVKSAIAIVIFAVAIFIFRNEITDTLFHSLKQKEFPTYRFFCWISSYFDVDSGFCRDIKFDIINTEVTGQFSFTMTLSIIGGIICAFPFILYQIWLFVKPGLKQNETKSTSGIIFYASILFFTGVLFGYYIVTALTIQFFSSFTIMSDIENKFTLGSYYGTVTWTSLMLGIFFQLPLVVYFLSKLDTINHLFLRKYRKHALVVILLLSAVITPPDIISQVLVSLPILILYEISILVSKRVITSKKSI